MVELFESMAWPFAACLVLTGIHVYLGIHVIERRVIFVDLALAQIAALGAVWGVLLGWSLESEPWTVKGFSLAFTVVGAAIFSMTRTRHERIPHEAIIGIIYAVALAGTVLASANLAHGAEEVRDLLAGSILWVRKETVLWTALLYFVVGLVHWVFRKPFFELSMVVSDSSNDRTEFDSRSRFWDFLFYVTFGFVVTSSVSIGGVLLVFTYLVIPAVAAMMFVTGIRIRLLFGWAFGSLVSAVGILVSYRSDLPSGPTIVVCFGVFLALAALVHQVRNAAHPVSSLVRSLLLAAGLVGFLGGSWFLRPTEHDSLDHRLTSPMPGERLQAIQSVLADASLEFEARPYLPDLLLDSDPAVRKSAFVLVVRRPERELLSIVANYLRSDSDLWREEAIGVLRSVGNPFCVDALHHAATLEADDYLRAEMGEALLALSDSRGIEILLGVMDEAPAATAREEAWDHLRAHSSLDLSFDGAVPADENDAQVTAIREWYRSRGGSLLPD